jgi:hypothetical protein
MVISALPPLDHAQAILQKAALIASLVGFSASATANVVTDWDSKAVALVGPGAPAEREIAIMHLAIFDAVNSIDRRYRPYLFQLDAAGPTSEDATAASAAGTVLAALHQDAAGAIKASLKDYLDGIADGEAKTNGIKLGEAMAEKLLQARAQDGANAPDSFRPRTKPGVYVPTAPVLGSVWPKVVPFVLKSAAQFRPPPPVTLKSQIWASDYNEIKAIGNKNSSERTAQQTETARFWLMTGPTAYHPLARELVLAKQLDVVDSARAMALYAVALTDAYIAVFDAKYHYEFWRPITAIRNGDIDGNPATTLDATWQPVDNTPMHPEYPCAHCIESGAAVAILESLRGSGDMPELSLTSPTAPGVTHRWTDLDSFATEVSNARIWAGFHYRFSTRVGTEMGRKIGKYVADNSMQRLELVGAK